MKKKLPPDKSCAILFVRTESNTSVFSMFYRSSVRRIRQLSQQFVFSTVLCYGVLAQSGSVDSIGSIGSANYQSMDSLYGYAAPETRLPVNGSYIQALTSVLQSQVPEPSLPAKQFLVPVPESCKQGECRLSLSLGPGQSMSCPPAPSCPVKTVVDSTWHLEPVSPYSNIHVEHVESGGSGETLHLMLVVTPDSEYWPADNSPLPVRIYEPGKPGFRKASMAEAIPAILCDPDEQAIDIGWLREHRQEQALLQQLQEEKPAPIPLTLKKASGRKEPGEDQTENMVIFGAECLLKMVAGGLRVPEHARRFLQEKAFRLKLQNNHANQSSVQLPGQWRARLNRDGQLVFEVMGSNGWQQASVELVSWLHGLHTKRIQEKTFPLPRGGVSSSGPYGFSTSHNLRLTNLFNRFRAEQDSKIRKTMLTPDKPDKSDTKQTETPGLQGPSDGGESESAKIKYPPGYAPEQGRRMPPAGSANPGIGKEQEDALSRLGKIRNKLSLTAGILYRWLSLLTEKKVNRDNCTEVLQTLKGNNTLSNRQLLTPLVEAATDAALDDPDNPITEGFQDKPTVDETPDQVWGIQRIGWALRSKSKNVHATKRNIYECMARIKDGCKNVKKPDSIEEIHLLYPKDKKTGSSTADISLVINVWIDMLFLNLGDAEAIQWLVNEVIFSLSQLAPSSAGQPGLEEPESGSDEDTRTEPEGYAEELSFFVISADSSQSVLPSAPPEPDHGNTYTALDQQPPYHYQPQYRPAASSQSDQPGAATSSSPTSLTADLGVSLTSVDFRTVANEMHPSEINGLKLLASRTISESRLMSAQQVLEQLVTNYDFTLKDIFTTLLEVPDTYDRILTKIREKHGL